MNTTITYDIFELAKDLKKAGINEAATDAIVKFEKTKDEAHLNTLATKKDLNDLEIRIELKIEKTYNKTIIWLSSVIGLATTILGLIQIYHG